MKKTYTKPQLIYESFSLASTTIASCAVDPTASEIGRCTLNVISGQDTGFYLFNTDYGACNVPAKQQCPYDVSGESYNVFAS